MVDFHVSNERKGIDSASYAHGKYKDFGKTWEISRRERIRSVLGGGRADVSLFDESPHGCPPPGGGCPARGGGRTRLEELPRTGARLAVRPRTRSTYRAFPMSLFPARFRVAFSPRRFAPPPSRRGASASSLAKQRGFSTTPKTDRIRYARKIAPIFLPRRRLVPTITTPRNAIAQTPSAEATYLPVPRSW